MQTTYSHAPHDGKTLNAFHASTAGSIVPICNSGYAEWTVHRSAEHCNTTCAKQQLQWSEVLIWKTYLVAQRVEVNKLLPGRICRVGTLGLLLSCIQSGHHPFCFLCHLQKADNVDILSTWYFRKDVALVTFARVPGCGVFTCSASQCCALTFYSDCPAHK